MNDTVIKYAVFIVLIVLVSACGKAKEQRKIKGLERDFFAENDPARKSALANRLHRAYSVYHLKYREDTTFLFNWGKMALAGKEAEVAINSFGRLLESDPSNGKAFLLRAEARILQHDHQAAYADLKKAQKYMPEAGLSQAIEKERKKAKIDSLIKASDRQLKKDPDNPYLYLARADLYYQVGFLQAALFDYNKSILLNDSNVTARFNKIQLLLDMNDLENASTELSEVSKLEKSGSEETVFNDLTARHRNKTDIHILEDSIAVFGMTVLRLLDLGKAYFKTGAFPGAAHCFSEAMAAEPDNFYAYLYRSQCFIKLTNYDAALSDINRALSIDPFNISAHNLRGFISFSTGHADEMKKEVEYILDHKGVVLPVLTGAMEKYHEDIQTSNTSIKNQE